MAMEVAVVVIMAMAVASLLATFPRLAVSQQQSYPAVSYSMDCDNPHPLNSGYLCSRAMPECRTYAYYVVTPYVLESQTGIATLRDLATVLFNTNASDIAAASNISASRIDAELTVGQLLFIPLDCKCLGAYAGMNVTYKIQPGDLFYKIANNTYQSLTTCQAMQDANPGVVVTDLKIGSLYTFPLRCACPNKQDLDAGFKMLITYTIQDRSEDVATVSEMFGVRQQDLISVNNLTGAELVFLPGTTVLIPLAEKPVAPPARITFTVSAPAILPLPSSSSSKGHLVEIGIGVAAAVLLLTLITCVSIWKRRSNSELQKPCSSQNHSLTSTNLKHKLQLQGFPMFDKASVYTAEDIKAATQDFSESCHIRGAVYRGVLKGGVLAVKKVARDVTQELQILQMVHHANLVRLLGVCMTGPDQSYLIYEYAENGSLSDWLHEKHKLSDSSPSLTWSMRLQIALDVATGLQYIHDHTAPSFVHKDIKSSNILLDSNFRGKIANFVLAKSTKGMGQEPSMTNHIIGTYGYMAPEYAVHGFVSPKIDVYAFGVVLLEMLSGEEAIARDEEGGQMTGLFLSESIGPVLSGANAKQKLKSWIDPVLQDAYPLDSAYQLAQLAKDCISEDPDLRPSMTIVAYMLAKMLQTTLEWEESSAGLEKTVCTVHELQGR